MRALLLLLLLLRLLLVLLLLLVVAIIVVVYRRDSVRKGQQVNALLMQMELLETNMAEECKRGI